MWRTAGWCLIAATFVAMIFQAAFYAPQLPNPMMSHFDRAGNPDGWMSKTALFSIYFVVQMALGGGLMGLARLIPILPTELINIPNKDYWMKEQNRLQFYQLNETAMTWIAAISIVMLSFSFQLVIIANLWGAKLHTYWTAMLLVVYFIVLGFVLFTFVRSLKQVPDISERSAAK